MKSDPFLRIPHEEMHHVFLSILLQSGFGAERAQTCAGIFTNNSMEGVYSHGVNRFFHFVDYIRKGFIQPQAVPEQKAIAGCLEQWDGNLGPGPLNALFASERSMALADEHGVGMVALSRTNHWMRGGTYGWHCAGKGYAFIGWTNTIANLPPWGSAENKLGNNPLVIAVPFQNEAIVLDMAMSQFSYGKLHEMDDRQQELPVFGGYDLSGKLTVIPGDILRANRPLPIGYWKGSSLSLMLDILAAILSGGLSTSAVTQQNKHEYGVSQVFVSVSLKKLPGYSSIQETLRQIISDYLSAIPESEQNTVRYPGQHLAAIRSRNMEKGIPVHPAVWSRITGLLRHSGH
ncbi:MAG: 3-dehydro-L-gulonate 2-dehydrogenase [Mangrovibacterium sp.]